MIQPTDVQLKLQMLDRILSSISISELTEIALHEEAACRLRGDPMSSQFISHLVAQIDLQEREIYTLKHVTRELKSTLLSVIHILETPDLHTPYSGNGQLYCLRQQLYNTSI